MGYMAQEHRFAREQSANLMISSVSSINTVTCVVMPCLALGAQSLSSLKKFKHPVSAMHANTETSSLMKI